MQPLRFKSPLPITQVASILRDQIQPATFFGRLNICKRPSSRVVGNICEMQLEIGSSADKFSKRLVGQLSQDSDGTVLEASWKIGFWSKIYSCHQSNEETIVSFLHQWGQFERVA